MDGLYKPNKEKSGLDIPAKKSVQTANEKPTKRKFL
ncbi:hypothetical protein J2T22_000616 [Pseudarthrobacter defluvii]|uniref:Uncharacterized protein n=1 Tax=Pseudarthrobacter defluvii TaxID=410837 RepID=A0ABT9UEL4_9MICC|nr:hypothetical protein [Pseudarthrobacter defluvii]